jgi:CheY-like chemotaxis protein
MPKILYIEDEPEIAELVKRWIEEDEEFQFLWARNGSAGLALAESERPDLILLDIRLEEFSIDGWEVNRRLKSSPVTRSIPVMALTAHSQRAEDRERALHEGFVEHMSKPFDYETLIERVGAHARGGGDR